MKSRNVKMSVLSLLVIAFILIAVSPANAVTRRAKVSNQGFYLGANLSINMFSGEFDDKIEYQYMQDYSRYLRIPDLDAAVGFGLAGGFRFRQSALELSFIHAKHDAIVWATPQNANINMLNLDFKYFLVPHSSTNPYLMAGLCIPWMSVEMAAYDENRDAISSAKFYGYGLNIGGGVTTNLSPRVSLTGGGVYRWISYGKFEGIYGDELNPDQGVDGSGFSFHMGIQFHFPSDF